MKSYYLSDVHSPLGNLTAKESQSEVANSRLRSPGAPTETVDFDQFVTFLVGKGYAPSVIKVYAVSLYTRA